MESQILAELQKLNSNIEKLLSRPAVVYAVDMGNLKQIMDVPQGAFAPEFHERLAEDVKQILNPRLKEKRSTLTELPIA
jgi:hypothetical protein